MQGADLVWEANVAWAARRRAQQESFFDLRAFGFGQRKTRASMLLSATKGCAASTSIGTPTSPAHNPSVPCDCR